MYFRNDEEKEKHTLTFNLSFPYDGDVVYLAHCYPYTYSDLQEYLTSIVTDPIKTRFTKLRLLCRTLAGNSVHYLTITAPTYDDELRRKRGVVITARVHPGETPSSWTMKGIIDFLTGETNQARELRKRFVFKLVPMLNPDGVIVGNNRCSLSGKDLNRQYRTVMRESYPSVWHTKLMIRRLLEECGVAIYCDLHAHSRKHNMFAYGCESKRTGCYIKLSEQVFPLMLHKNAADKFSFENCKFHVEKGKEGTGRLVIWSMGVQNSYTMEASMGGSKIGSRSGTHFSTQDYEQIGKAFCETLLDFYDDNPTKTNRAVMDLPTTDPGSDLCECWDSADETLAPRRGLSPRIQQLHKDTVVTSVQREVEKSDKESSDTKCIVLPNIVRPRSISFGENLVSCKEHQKSNKRSTCLHLTRTLKNTSPLLLGNHDIQIKLTSLKRQIWMGIGSNATDNNEHYAQDPLSWGMSSYMGRERSCPKKLQSFAYTEPRSQGRKCRKKYRKREENVSVSDIKRSFRESEPIKTKSRFKWQKGVNINSGLKNSSKVKSSFLSIKADSLKLVNIVQQSEPKRSKTGSRKDFNKISPTTTVTSTCEKPKVLKLQEESQPRLRRRQRLLLQSLPVLSCESSTSDNDSSDYHKQRIDNRKQRKKKPQKKIKTTPVPTRKKRASSAKTSRNISSMILNNNQLGSAANHRAFWCNSRHTKMSTAGPEVLAESAAAAAATGLSATAVFFSLLIPALVLYFIYFRISRRHMIELAEKIPGPRGYPLIGNAHEFLGSSDAIFRNIYDKSFEYDQLIRVWIGPKLLVFLVDPRDVEVILSSHVYIDKSTEYRFFKPWLGNGLLISTGQKWRAHRKLIAPTFHLNVLKSFIDLFNANSHAVVEKLRKEGEKQFDVHNYMSECTVEILLETAMGVSKTTQDRSGFEYAMAVMKMCDILHLRHTKVWLRPDWLFNLTKYGKDQIKLLEIIHGLTKKVIQRKKEEYKSGKRNIINTAATPKNESKASFMTVEGLSFGQSAGLKDDLDVDDNDVGEKKRQAFLDLLMEAGQNGVVLTDEEVKEQVDTIMFEGHDTTASGSSFFLSMMGCHPDIQEKVIAELDEIFGDSDRPATFQDTLQMKYLERCLMETLRMYPPVPLIAREIKTDLKLASGDYTIPAGATVAIATIKMHRMAHIYPNPDTFNPDNFLPENTANRHYYAFIPFSAGPRSCVGRKYAMLKLKILLSTILRNFRVRSDIKETDFRLQADIILKRAEGFKVRLEPRKPAAAKA
ncbi:hypothetical protein KM043_009543 [Ampulex compressa]|nr:hypothetical protein KM043_009543 [Ampulex compressa]